MEKDNNRNVTEINGKAGKQTGIGMKVTAHNLLILYNFFLLDNSSISIAGQYDDVFFPMCNK